MKRIFEEYKIEIIAVLLVLVGIFMVLNLSIRETLLASGKHAGNAFVELVGQVWGWLGERAAAMTPGDFFGSLLIVTALGFIVWRIRYRFKTDQRWSIEVCPKCSSPIMRVHRKFWDRLLGTTIFPEARRYTCVNAQCSWTGLLRKHVHHRRSRAEQVAKP